MSKMKRFALIGAAGFVAPRHMKAIRDGVIDSYFPDADYFTESERFDRHLDKLRRQKEQKIDYVAICSPNYLHDAHIRLALRNQADAICEKPLVLNPWNIDALKEVEKETGKRINVILQVRLHPEIIKLKQQMLQSPAGKVYDVNLTYITSRGNWYYRSWKGEAAKSGGVATNIGIHFFDMLIDLFGQVKKNVVHYSDEKTVAGFMQLERARIKWFLSLDFNLLPNEVKVKGQRTYRSITIDNEEIEFSGGFTDLHTESYKRIIEGKGFSADDARPSIQTAYEIRNAKPLGLKGDYHELLKNVK